MFIPSTNVFMPEELRMLLGGTAFSLGKDMDLQIENLNSVKADVFRTSIGITGELGAGRSEEHTSELQSLMRISYAVFCLKKKKEETNKISTALMRQYTNKIY